MVILSLAQTHPMVRSVEITSRSIPGLSDEDIVSMALWPLALVAATDHTDLVDLRKIKANFTTTCLKFTLLTPEKLQVVIESVNGGEQLEVFCKLPIVVRQVLQNVVID